MTDLQKELDAAFAILHDIPVSGDNVDRMMAIREHLRKAYRMAEPKEPKEAEQNGG